MPCLSKEKTSKARGTDSIVALGEQKVLTMLSTITAPSINKITAQMVLTVLSTIVTQSRNAKTKKQQESYMHIARRQQVLIMTVNRTAGLQETHSLRFGTERDGLSSENESQIPKWKTTEHHRRSRRALSGTPQ